MFRYILFKVLRDFPLLNGNIYLYAFLKAHFHIEIGILKHQKNEQKKIDQKQLSAFEKVLISCGPFQT